MDGLLVIEFPMDNFVLVSQTESSLTNPDSYTYEENKLGHERSRWPQHRQASMTHRYILFLKEKIKCITICITDRINSHAYVDVIMQ